MKSDMELVEKLTRETASTISLYLRNSRRFRILEERYFKAVPSYHVRFLDKQSFLTFTIIVSLKCNISKRHFITLSCNTLEDARMFIGYKIKKPRNVKECYEISERVRCIVYRLFDFDINNFVKYCLRVIGESKNYNIVFKLLEYLEELSEKYELTFECYYTLLHDTFNIEVRHVSGVVFNLKIYDSVVRLSFDETFEMKSFDIIVLKTVIDICIEVIECLKQIGLITEFS